MADESDFDDLLAANRTYAETFEHGGFDGVAHAGVAIVTCMDSRIDPLSMLGLSHGDAKIFYGGDLEMLGEQDEAMLLPDALHPGAEGHRLMSRRYVELVWPRLRELGTRNEGRQAKA